MQAVVYGGFVQNGLAQQFYCSVYDPDGQGAAVPTGQIALTHIKPDGTEAIALYHPKTIQVVGNDSAVIEGQGVLGDTGPILVTVAGTVATFDAPGIDLNGITLARVSLEALKA